MELFSLQIDPITKTYINEVSRWSRILAISGFVLCAMLILMGVLFGSVFGMAGEGAMSNEFSGFIALTSALTNIVLAVLYFFPCLFLFRFSKSINRALATNNQEHLNEGFAQLRNTFRFVGVVSLIVIFFFIFSAAMMIMVLI